MSEVLIQADLSSRKTMTWQHQAKLIATRQTLILAANSITTAADYGLPMSSRSMHPDTGKTNQTHPNTRCAAAAAP
jgi:hypothetical protein